MKKFFMISMLCCLLGVQGAWAEDIQTKRVLLLKSAYVHSDSDTNAGLDDDEIAAADWFYTNYASQKESDVSNLAKGAIISPNDLTSKTLNPAITKVVWVHIDGDYDSDLSNALNKMSLSDEVVTALSDYVKGGGNLYITNYATPLVWKIGRITDGQKPNLVNNGRENTKGINPKIGYGNGLQLFDHSQHAIFKNMTSESTFSGTTYPLISGGNEHTGLIWDFGPITGKTNAADHYRVVDFEIVTNSIVLGTWEHVADYALGGIIEFLPAGDYKGRIIANGMGGYEWHQNDGTNTYQSNIEQLTSNCLEYLCTDKKRKVAYILPNDNNDTVDGDDEATALEWFQDEIVTPGKGDVLHPSALADLDPTEYTTIWIHIDRDGDAALIGNWGDIDDANYRTLLTRYAKNGGNLLLTKHAVQLVGNFSGNGLGRCGTDPSVETGGGWKNNEDMWVINTVIGAGYVSENNYIRYLETEAGKYEQQEWKAEYLISDNRSNSLYFNMKTISDTYPIANTGGDTKYEVLSILGPGVKEDHNVIWKFDEINNKLQSNVDYISGFQTGNNCVVLGQWGHKTAADNAVIVKFNSTGVWNANAWEGSILCIGLGAYEWQPSNSDGTARSGENPYINNIKQLTYNALNILDNPSVEDTSDDYTYGGVTYELHTRGVLHYAVIKSAAADLQVYDLTKNNGLIDAGQITKDGVTYNITNILSGAFTGCTQLAYADLMAFQGVVPTNVRDYFHGHTLIYLPREEVSAITGCIVTGENIVNTLKDNTKVSEKLKVYDNVSGSTYTYYLFANKYRFTANAVEFNREFTANKSTVALPFAIAKSELAQFGTFYGFEGVVSGEKVKFKEVSSTEANVPYMIVPISNGISISINNPKTIDVLDGAPDFDNEKYTLTTSVPYSVEKTGGKFITDYRPQVFANAKSQGIYCYYSDGKYKTTVSGTIYADPFRGYVKLDTPVSSTSGAPAAFAVLFEDLDGSTTAIGEVPVVSEQSDVYYTLSGMPVKNPTPGVYIKNNKKVIIK